MSPVFLVLFLLPTIFVLLAAALNIRNNESWKKKKKKNNGLNLPPGSMGWPFIGDTLAFRRPYHCTSLGAYIEECIAKYGKIYKANLLGTPTILSVDAEFNRFVLLNDNKLFAPSFPRAVSKILGETSMLVITGEAHRYQKSLAVNFMGGARLRNGFVRDSDTYVKQNLDSWVDDTPFTAKEECCKITFNLMVKNILSMNPGDPEAESLRKLYTFFMKGVTSIPIDLPGTPYRKAIQARHKILKIVGRLMEERICDKEEGRDRIGVQDLLGFILEQSSLDAEQFGELLVGLLFGGHETSSVALTLALYFLPDCPRAVEQLRSENLQIVNAKKRRGEPPALTWDDYKQMEFTHCVVSETLRLGNVIKFVHRKATTDIQYKGFDIPRGWHIIPVLAAAHLDDANFENAQRFDPWRWQSTSRSTASTENFMPFGRGSRNCGGLELAKLEIAVFIHHLVLNFDWQLAERDEPMSFVVPQFAKDLPIKVHRLSILE